ncbi:hypothetical protein IMZ11_04340 [Microtetraspora sp. AC03309]|uniref:hypothetical protein n=1 Tax=Microtetraspora sp. AC03309 TaxID=2779376 RepID=UPI001E36DA1B|nr:hypothetical protein [Microtetraspora sp. AC03309]MCC5574865.1 hypothetical protein [Microtetraspora sp. AC03309]
MTVYDVAARLPEIPALRDHCRALAMLDAILSPEWESRYHSFDAHWRPGEEMASMSNGSGDAYSIVFTSAGAYIRGFDHESPMSPWGNDDLEVWPGVLDTVPEVFRTQVAEPAFTRDGVPDVTACLWRTATGTRWQTGEIDFAGHSDGADWLFGLLTERSADAYRTWACDYFETEVPLAAVEHVHALRPLTGDIIWALNADVSLADLADDIAEIGYPTD